MVSRLLHQGRKGRKIYWKRTGDTIESKSIDMEKKCLVEETSVDYGESGTFMKGDSDHTPKSLCVKIKKVLRKPLSVINYNTVNAKNDVLNDFFLLPPPLLIKPSVQVSVHKFFALDINLVAIARKFSQKKLSFIRKIFLGVNDFGGAFTSSKFGRIIRATFTSESAMMTAGKLAHNHSVVINTNLKHLGNIHTNQSVVIRKIPVGTSIEAVCVAVSEFEVIELIKMQLVGLWQKAIIILGNQIQADLLASKWSIFIGKDAVYVAKTDVDKQTWNFRDRFKALLYTLPVRTNTHNLWDFLGSIGGKTCIIDCNSVNYTRAHCATVCFVFEDNITQAVANTPSCLVIPLCSGCNSFGHSISVCKLAGVSSNPKSKRALLSAQDWFRLAKIYEKKSAPISCLLAFGGKTWVLVVGSSSSNDFFGYDSQLGSIKNDVLLPFAVDDLEKCLISIESSLVSLVKQIGELAKNPGCQPPVTLPSQNQGEDIVIRVGSNKAISGKTTMTLDFLVSPHIIKLENMLEGLSKSIFSLTACFDGLKIVMCNVRGMNNSAKQNDIVCWHLEMGNLVSIVTETKLKGGNFNEDGFHKSTSFRKCFDLGLMNSLGGSLFAKTPIWCNSCGVAKTIDYVFVSSNLVNAMVDHGIDDVVDYFDIDHKAVSVSVGVGGLLNV
ncbi:hypothetical protein G9A89_006455 [Geosiphon pyriformis]|nr:hypothetical protein G9A89_006455 [Geosiphon pyriformis]